MSWWDGTIFGWTWRFKWTGYRCMDLLVERKQTTNNTVLGNLSIDGAFECFTLERLDKIIPTGTYKVTLYDSPRWGFKVPILHDVPGRQFIEIHIANYANQLEGCIAVGSQEEVEALDNSRLAFTALMVKLEKADDIVITVV